jgi:hypothetical protein
VGISIERRLTFDSDAGDVGEQGGEAAQVIGEAPETDADEVILRGWRGAVCDGAREFGRRY